MTAGERRARRTARHAVRRHPGRAFPAVCLLALAFVVAPFGMAYAHSSATYCGHSRTGVLHRQAYVVSFDRYGVHYHVVQLGHPFDSTPEYDTIRC